MVQRSDSSSVCNSLKTQYNVVCGNKTGVLHTDRLGSGSKGKCIFNDSSEVKWFTPKEFEKFGGRETSKDWKRSVKLDGKPFYYYLNNAELKIHAFNCYCQICNGEGNDAGGPIKFFSPPNRKRRAEDELAMPSMITKSTSSSSQNNSHIETAETTEMNQLLSLINQSIDSVNCFSNDDSQSGQDSSDLGISVATASVPSNKQEATPTNKPPFHNTKPSQCRQIQSTDDLKQCVTIATEQIESKTKHIEDKINSLGVILNSIKSEVSSLKNMVQQFEESRQHSPLPLSTLNMANGRLPNEFKNAITDTLAQVLSQTELSKKRQREDSGHCANCNRPAPFKCGRCNRVRYCSEFCQQRDWPIHNKICGAKVPATDKSDTINEDVSKMNLSQLKEQVIRQTQNNSQSEGNSDEHDVSESTSFNKDNETEISEDSGSIKVEQIEVDEEQ